MIPGFIGRTLEAIRLRMLAWTEARLTQRFALRGMVVLVKNTRPDIDTQFVLARLDEALGLIERHQPWRLAHLRRDVDQLWVTSYPCRGAYLAQQGTVMTELSFLARAAEFSTAQVASSILHESVHARVHRMTQRLGLVGNPRDMAREERLCRRAELAFGRALAPDVGAPVVQRASWALELRDAEVAPAIDWREAHARKAEEERAAVEAWRGH